MRHVAVVGAGMGGLSAAADLARQGYRVSVFDKEATPGGKLRAVRVGEASIDAGPTVFTMRWVFDGLFEAAGETLEGHLQLERGRVMHAAFADKKGEPAITTLLSLPQAEFQFDPESVLTEMPNVDKDLEVLARQLAAASAWKVGMRPP